MSLRMMIAGLEIHGRGRALALLAAAIGLGCGQRALDPNQAKSGTGGGMISTGTGGATGDGGVGVTVDGGVSADAPPDSRPRGDAPVVDAYLPPVPCGNGVIDPGEECDDGNAISGDGCSRVCQIEACWACGTCGTGVPCVVKPICGDGVITPPERCDDGNRSGGDGCSADCNAIEAGWQCDHAGYRCFPICGDGLIVGGETCDDGNAIAGDGCSDFCLVEPTNAHCGDGMIEGAEQCDSGDQNQDGRWGFCTTHCRFAVCGDGIVNGPEQCDLGLQMNVSTYGNMVGCTPSCTFPHFCGDAILDDAQGEQCDQGPANGTSTSYCSRDCKVLL